MTSIRLITINVCHYYLWEWTIFHTNTTKKLLKLFHFRKIQSDSSFTFIFHASKQHRNYVTYCLIIIRKPPSNMCSERGKVSFRSKNFATTAIIISSHSTLASPHSVGSTAIMKSQRLQSVSPLMEKQEKLRWRDKQDNNLSDNVREWSRDVLQSSVTIRLTLQLGNCVSPLSVIPMRGYQYLWGLAASWLLGTIERDHFAAWHWIEMGKRGEAISFELRFKHTIIRGLYKILLFFKCFTHVYFQFPILWI